jgi:hypothetical protein
MKIDNNKENETSRNSLSAAADLVMYLKSECNCYRMLF